MTTSAPAPKPSARRSAAAGLISLLIPGAGHAILGRRVAAVLFFLPVALLVVAAVGYYSGGGEFRFLAFVVTPGVLPALAILNVLLAAWRIAAVADAARRTGRPGLALAVVGPAALLLIVAPHVWLGSTIAATNDFLDSTFASANDPQPTEEPWVTPPPDWTLPPYFFGTEPPESVGPVESEGPQATKGPRPPNDSGLGTLPPLGVRVPWQAPGAVPWGDDGRFDLLLLGSDAGPDRWSRRMDVMLLVEIDVNTGKVAMVGIPRNLQNAPLPKGSAARQAVACGCFQPLLNALYVEATVVHPERWPGTGSTKGIGAVRSTISELTGRPVDAVLVADLWGVIKVVDAMGGIDINVPYSIYDKSYPDPVVGKSELYIKAGKQHFDGRMALAYARSRHQDSDYGRMARQQTLLLAIRNDIGPKTILNAPDLFRAAKGFTWTDLPRESLPNLVELFGKAANAGVKNLRIVPPQYPAWMTKSLVTKVQKDIAHLMGLPWPPPANSPSPTPTPTPAGTIAPSAPGGSPPPTAPAPP